MIPYPDEEENGLGLDVGNLYALVVQWPQN